MAEPKVSKKNIYQKINLKELFGVDFGNDTDLKEYVGQLIIEKIRQRTEAGVDIDGDAFKAYSKKYIESLPFKAFGKDDGAVNMTLSGDMLGLMDIIDSTRNVITIGWSDETNKLKAANHNGGYTLPKRTFFGVTEKELKAIVNETEDDIKEALNIKKTEGDTAYQEKLSDLIGNLKDIEEG
jgi:hypothetical protein